MAHKTYSTMEFDPSLLTLEENGVCVKRNICDGPLCEIFLLEADKAFDRMLALPGTMSRTSSMSSVSGNRHFITILTSPNDSKTTHQMEASHRRDFRLPYSSLVESLLLRSLNSNEAPRCLENTNDMVSASHNRSRSIGCILTEVLGENAELSALSVIRSEPGCAAQSFHSDSEYCNSNPRICTVFLVLHDILEETLGPTEFYANTSSPCHFENNMWVPPTPDNIQIKLRSYSNTSDTRLWFGPLNQGDAVLMDSCTWHRGGANTSNEMRTILAISFEEAKSPLRGSENRTEERLKLCDFINKETNELA